MPGQSALFTPVTGTPRRGVAQTYGIREGSGPRVEKRSHNGIHADDMSSELVCNSASVHQRLSDALAEA